MSKGKGPLDLRKGDTVIIRAKGLVVEGKVTYVEHYGSYDIWFDAPDGPRSYKADQDGGTVEKKG